MQHIELTSVTLTQNSASVVVDDDIDLSSIPAGYLLSVEGTSLIMSLDGGADQSLTLSSDFPYSTITGRRALIIETVSQSNELMTKLSAIHDKIIELSATRELIFTSDDETIEYIDRLGNSHTLSTQKRLENAIAEAESLTGSINAMTKAEFERIRLNELNSFNASGTDNVDFDTSFEFQQVNGWQNKFKIKANKTKINGVWHNYGDTTITNFDAPNGLQNKDLTTADFTDLAAAIVAGGTSLSESYLNQRVIVYAVQEDIVATGLTTAEIQNPLNNVYSDNGILRQRAMTFEKERLLESVAISTTPTFQDSINAMTSLGWTQSSSVKGEFEKDGKIAVVISLIESRNQGAYHPSYNPEGCATYLDTGVDGNVKWYSSLGISYYTTVSSCFTFGNDLVNSSSGDISNSNNNGRFDSEYYDAIDASNVKDLRMSSRRRPLSEIREEAKRKAIAGEIRGFEGVPFQTTASISTIFNAKSAEPTWATIIATDTVFDSTFPNGCCGLLSTTKPNGALDTFPLDRKALEVLIGLRSTNEGSTWSTFTPTINTTTNSVTLTNEPSTNIVLIVYKTQAHFTEDGENLEVLSIGDVFFNSYHVNSILNSTLIGKVPTANGNTNYAEMPLTTYSLSNQNLISKNNRDIDVTHETTVLVNNGNSSAVKLLPVLAFENGQILLNIVYKEMVYDTDWGDDNKFQIADGTNTMTDDNGNDVLYGIASFQTQYFYDGSN